MDGMTPVTEAAGWWSRLVSGFGWRDAIDITLVAVIVTYLLRAMRDTRALQLLRGLLVIVVAVMLARHFSLTVTTWLLDGLLVMWAIALIIILQPELRRIVAALGERTMLRNLFPQAGAPHREIAEAARMMMEQGWGGLIVIERETSLAGFAESGIRIDAEAKAALIAAVFTPGSPLHDGAVIMREGRLYAAACILPLSESQSHAASFGMRHRAAIGITEETDAIVVVVSEEQRKAALAKNGQLTPPLDMETLEEMLDLHCRRGRG
jgi:diadenylate cyclase